MLFRSQRQGSEQERTKVESSTKVTASSPDPKTQKIFNDLFPESQRPAVLQLSRESMNPKKSEPMVEKNEPRFLPENSQTSREREFESFLKSMFETTPQVDQKTVQKNQRDPKLLPNKEHEFLDFLNSL